jgi:hypothetical protein
VPFSGNEDVVDAIGRGRDYGRCKPNSGYPDVAKSYNDPQKLDHRLRCFFDTILETCGGIQMTTKRREHGNQFKFKIALEASQ